MDDESWRSPAIAADLEVLLLGPRVRGPVYVSGMVRGIDGTLVPDIVPLAMPTRQLMRRSPDGRIMPSGLLAFPDALARSSGGPADMGAYFGSSSYQARLEPVGDDEEA